MSGDARFGEELKTLFPWQERGHTFPAFYARNLERLRAHVLYHARRWSQTLHDEEDLLQEAVVGLVQGVQTWDPNHPSGRTLLERVESCMGRAVERALKYAAGWPDPRRKAPRRQVDLGEHFDRAVDARGQHEAVQEDAAYLSAVCGGKRSMTRYVLPLVMAGKTLDEIAVTIASDPRASIRYRARTASVARRKVQRVMSALKRGVR